MKEQEEKAQAEKKERDAAVLDFDPDAEEAAEEDAAESKTNKCLERGKRKAVFTFSILLSMLLSILTSMLKVFRLHLFNIHLT